MIRIIAIVVALTAATSAIAAEPEIERLKERVAKLERERAMQRNYDYANRMWWGSVGIGTTMGPGAVPNTGAYSR